MHGTSRIREKRDGPPGYTLVEAVAVVAVLGTLLFLGAKLSIQMARLVNLNTARVDIQRDARSAMALLERGLRQAVKTSVLISQKPGQPPHSSITFTRFIKGGAATEQVQYYQEGKHLYMETPGGKRPISGTLRLLSFTYPKSGDLGLIAISMSFEKKTSGGDTKTLQMSVEKVRLMN
jgi:type II secretory pathway pseudopilin PulG